MQDLTYEQAILELQSIVNNLQKGSTNIDQMANQAHRAAELIKLCKQKLRHTETQIENLLPEMELKS